jgi:imidazolonepropionase-like amidohydrolase
VRPLGHEGRDALRTVTIDAARLLQVDASCGSIEPGKRADLSVYDGDPLMLATDHVMTLSGGCIVT